MVSEVHGSSSGIIHLLETPSRPEDGAQRVRVDDHQAGSPASSDRVVLTDMAAKLQALEKSVADLPEVDPKRVEAIRQAIAEGTYQVNARRIADKLIRFESMLPGKGDD